MHTYRKRWLGNYLVETFPWTHASVGICTAAVPVIETTTLESRPRGCVCVCYFPCYIRSYGTRRTCIPYTPYVYTYDIPGIRTTGTRYDLELFSKLIPLRTALVF